MITDGKVIVEAPDGKRYVICGMATQVYLGEKSKKPYMDLYGSVCAMRLKLREIKRDKDGRKFK